MSHPKNNLDVQLAKMNKSSVSASTAKATVAKSGLQMAGLAGIDDARKKPFTFAVTSQQQVHTASASASASASTSQAVQQTKKRPLQTSTFTPAVSAPPPASHASSVTLQGSYVHAKGSGKGKGRRYEETEDDEQTRFDDSGFVDAIDSAQSSSKRRRPSSPLQTLIGVQQASSNDHIEALRAKLLQKEKTKSRMTDQLLEAMESPDGCSSMDMDLDTIKAILNTLKTEIPALEAQIAAAGGNYAGQQYQRNTTTQIDRSSNSPIQARVQQAVQQRSRASFPPPNPPARAYPPPQNDTDEFDRLLEEDDMDVDEVEEVSRSPIRRPLQQHKQIPKQNKVVPANRTEQQHNPTSSPQIHAGPGKQIGRSEKTRSGPPATQVGAVSTNIEHPWSRCVRKALRMRFKLEDFRANQLEAINATLSGRDVFVLMPTGGGKSICYQLPAVVSTGKTKGVTIVISPLLSLITDQVTALGLKDISVCTLNSTTPAEDRRFTVDRLKAQEPTCSLVYVTPEMINQSGQFKDIVQGLYSRQRLARFVVDEAHCVSQWGHDLRPDYKQLGSLKTMYPDIPLIALTATANARVKEDIKQNLNIKGCLTLSQSFNRPNLYYEVRPKSGATTIQDISNFIQKEHKGETGIVYCLSKRSCEETADKLKQFGVKAHHYHAGMDKNDRTEVQQRWQKGIYTVICATIAFGMGIDKADVRFVVHYTIPSSLEGYYQETGRAGRDGKPSVCILYYNYADTRFLTRFIYEGDGTQEQKTCQMNNLNRVVQFCINRFDCRRTLVLQYFGEKFNRTDCNANCDNCRLSKAMSHEVVDYTEQVKNIIRLVEACQRDKVTMIQVADIFRGSKAKKIVEKNQHELPGAGRGSSMDRDNIDRLFHLICSEGILKEQLSVNKAGYTSAYVQLGPNANQVTRGGKRIKMDIAQGGQKIPSSKTSVAKRQKLLPPQGKPIRTGKHTFIEEEEEEEEEVQITTVKTKKRTVKRADRRQVQQVDEEDEDGEWVGSESDGSVAGDAGYHNDDGDIFVADDDEEEEEEDIDSDLEIVSNEQWKQVQTQRAGRGDDPTKLLYDELNDCVAIMAADNDIEIEDSFDIAVQTIAALCPTVTMGDFMKIEGFEEHHYDMFGVPFKKITAKYAKKANKLVGTQPPAARQSTKAGPSKIKKPPSVISIKSTESNRGTSSSSSRASTSTMSASSRGRNGNNRNDLGNSRTGAKATSSKAKTSSMSASELHNKFTFNGKKSGGRTLGSRPGSRGIQPMPM